MGQFSGSIKQSGKFMFNSQQVLSITKSVGNFIAVGLHYFSVVENPEFKQMLHELEHRCVIPSQIHFSQNVIPDLYDEVGLQGSFGGYAGCSNGGHYI